MYVTIKPLHMGVHYAFHETAEQVVDAVESILDLVVVLPDEALDDYDVPTLIELIQSHKPRTVREIMGQ